MPGGTAKLNWEGEKISWQMAQAAAEAINEVMKDCEEEAKAGHGNPTFEKPHSAPREKYFNQTGALTTSIRILEFAHVAPQRHPIGHPSSGQFSGGPSIVSGSWGSDMDYALYVEIGTSMAPPSAEDRVKATLGDPDEISDPKPVRMWPRIYAPPSRGFLRPAADIYYRTLAKRVAAKFQAKGGTNMHGLPGYSITYITPKWALPIP